ncbi:short-chain dehydrogenase/reductase [Azorhizobium oxalatiphilum]|uniref:Short-chain dehydrogenase/reductase n=1 Tax=Azorhizobium oxalatiphilum TaxID=980631 RepID=A0A917BYM0_9HYPH|nr:short-chain dehydrogenase/reductase [Azorhizobium oxalatiphilum]GGF63249.1 short-chain dehydrogenase/reductase [Azorhizobium oxalatiphilum]
MDLQLNGRRVLITGGSKGIGAACARVFLKEGCAVLLAARDAGQLAATAQELAPLGPVTTWAGDLSRPEERERLHEEAGGYDILINNAGAIPRGGLLDLTMVQWEAAWALKVMGYIHLTQLALGAMQARGSGVIVNIIGSAGRHPRYGYVCGATGNAALMAFTEAVGGKAPDFGVRVFGINPAGTRTERMVTLAAQDGKTMEDVSAGAPFGRLAEPLEIARTAVFMASPACGYVSGTVLDVDAGSGNK